MKAKKIIIPVSIVAGIAAIGAAIVALGNSAASVSYADTIRIQEKELENKISAGGTVQSANTEKVYSKLSYPVEKINVSVGDAVKKGDILCTIDTEELQQQILQQQASVDSSGISSDYTLSDAEQRYRDALDDYNNGENSIVLNAKNALDQAEKNLESAKRQAELGINSTLPSGVSSAKSMLDSAKLTYDNSMREYEKAENALKPENYSGEIKTIYDKYTEYKDYYKIVKYKLYNAELSNAQNRYDNAAAAYDVYSSNTSIYSVQDGNQIVKEYNEAKLEYENAAAKFDEKNLKKQFEAYENQYNYAVENLEKARDAAKSAMESAKLAYERAQSDYKNTEEKSDSSAEDFNIAVKNAEDAYETAKNNYEIAVNQAEADIASLKKQAEHQRTLSGINNPNVIMLENLKNKLDYAVITAPCDGIVTAVNAEEGVMATGALFVIEDLSSLKISATVGEYDIPYIGEGMEAVIRCDALNGSEYDGKITRVDPTPMANGGATVSYKIEASVDGKDTDLIVGMSTKLNIICERKSGALTVTYDALTTDENGNDVIYIAEKDETGAYHAKMIPVEIGLETDYEIEIISDQISSGMYVLTDTAMLTDGAVVMINEEEQEQNETEKNETKQDETEQK